jgi:large subunit ribosomal protein L17
MRHNKAINHLGRKSSHRKAMLANMSCSIIKHKRINTTVAKAKALKMYLEPLVTKSKEDTTHSRRMVFSYLKDKEAIKELFGTIAPKIADRPGGYLRVLHNGFRQGDGADMAIVEFVDFNEAALASKPEKKEEKKTTRRSRSKKAAAPKAEEAAQKAEAPAERLRRQRKLLQRLRRLKKHQKLNKIYSMNMLKAVFAGRLFSCQNLVYFMHIQN